MLRLWRLDRGIILELIFPKVGRDAFAGSWVLGVDQPAAIGLGPIKGDEHSGFAGTCRSVLRAGRG